MIAMLDGTIAAHESDDVLVLCGGVGYRVFVAGAAFEVGERVRLYIAEVIREDRHDLYGFASREEFTFFTQLTGVQGVGPKMAQKIMGAGRFATVAGRIQAGDIDFLSSISGVGKKTAQKIVLDLKGVLVAEKGKDLIIDDVTEALLGLGYSRADIAGIIDQISGDTPEQRLKSALKYLAR